MIYVNVDENSGEIVQYWDMTPESWEINKHLVKDNVLTIESDTVIDRGLYYHDLANTWVIRPEMPGVANTERISADGTELFILSGLPVGCNITVNDEDITAVVGDDQEFGFPTIFSGDYTVTAVLFPYITRSWRVTAYDNFN